VSERNHLVIRGSFFPPCYNNQTTALPLPVVCQLVRLFEVLQTLEQGSKLSTSPSLKVMWSPHHAGASGGGAL
jgi:hypothetical protein